MAQATVPVTFNILGLADLKEANAELKRMGGTTGNVARATRTTARFGSAAQNASYQVQDLIVQIQGGTDPMRALSQQLPQMTVGMGAWGAAIGLAAAAIPALIAGMTDTSEAAGTLDEQLESLNENIDALNDIGSSMDMSNWVQSFNELDLASRAIARNLLEVRIQLAEIDLEAASANIQGFANSLLGGNMSDIQISSMANNLGVTIAEMERLVQLVQQNGGSVLGNPEALAEMADILGQSGNADMLRRLQELVEAQTALEEARAVSRVTTNQGTLQEVEVTAKRIQARTPTEAKESIEEVAEATALADLAMQSFGRNFESALMGVANGTQDLSEAFKRMTVSILADVARLAATRYLTSAFGLTPNAQGNVISGGEVVPFARGGVVSSPTVFPMARGMGLMGEAGPEAIAPLRRTASGDLGVQAVAPVININNNAQGVNVTARDSGNGNVEIDVYLDAVAGAIERGGNRVANAMENAYALGRGRGIY